MLIVISINSQPNGGPSNVIHRYFHIKWYFIMLSNRYLHNVFVVVELFVRLLIIACVVCRVALCTYCRIEQTMHISLANRTIWLNGIMNELKWWFHLYMLWIPYAHPPLAADAACPDDPRERSYWRPINMHMKSIRLANQFRVSDILQNLNLLRVSAASQNGRVPFRIF